MFNPEGKTKTCIPFKSPSKVSKRQKPDRLAYFLSRRKELIANLYNVLPYPKKKAGSIAGPIFVKPKKRSMMMMSVFLLHFGKLFSANRNLIGMRLGFGPSK